MESGVYMYCSECKSEMILEDKDYNFKGNYDNYLICPNCLVSCVEEIRFGRTHRLLWHSENNGVKDWSVKYANTF